MSNNNTVRQRSKRPLSEYVTEQVDSTIRSMDDVVARQYLPDEREAKILPEENADPIGDNRYSPVKGLVHRYPDRVLLKITDTCAVYCRFCFRKEMVGKGAGMLSPFETKAALDYIRANPQIREVILSGGDPLTLSNRRLGILFSQLEAIDHLDIIRIHTRAPMVEPERIDQEFVSLLQEQKKAVFIVVHVNHAQEINDAVKESFFKLSRSGATLLSQTVLLKNINDDAMTLETLFRTLLANRVKPYYLHHPDLAPGTGHFRVSIKQGQDIIRQLRGRVTGLAYPTYVLDIPGGYGKIPLTPSYAQEEKDGAYLLEDFQGRQHSYPPQTVSKKT